MTDVRFTVLGRVAIEVDGVDVRIPGRRERAVLGLLLAGRGQVVPVGRLIDDIWGESPTDSAQGSLQVAVSRLRGLVEPRRLPRAAPELLISSGAGYALVTRPGSVDAERYADLVDEAYEAQAAGRADQVLELCQEADRLWNGTPFAEVVESDLVDGERSRLEDRRGCSLELRAEAMLALGRHALVTGELEGVVAEYPYRERLWKLYALALYRAGRQADALDVLRRVRVLLRDELGVDPSPELRQLGADVLAQDPRLDGRSAVLRSESTDPQPKSDHSGLVGREAMLEQLQEGLRRVVADGVGRTVVVSGEAGIGKTRLVTELGGCASREGARVLWGRCHEADVSPAYWPWVPIMRELAGTHPPREVAEMLTASAGTSSGDAGAAALRTYDAAARLLATAAHEGPIVLLIEDIHWADTASLQLLAYAAEALRDQPVLLVATVRADVLSNPLQVCLAALGRASAERLELEGLAEDAVHRLVAGLTGSEVEDELAVVVAERTDGNPFFVIELVRLLEARQSLDAEAARSVDVPHGVQDVLRLRLARLPEAVRGLLGMAAAVGRGFQLDVVSEVAGLTADVALDLLDAAVASKAVEEADAPGRYRFTHALVRETLYGSMSLARRGFLHAAIAEVLEPRLTDDPDLVAEVAHHFVLGAAILPELAEPAARHSMTAARLAEAGGALDQALNHWEHALTADDSAPGQDVRRRYEILLGLGRARHRRADIAGSREALGAAMNLARELDDQELMAEAATSFRGVGVWHWREFGTSDPAMVSVLEECVDTLGPGQLRTRVLVSLAMELTYEWRSAEAEDIGWKAVDSARELADDDLFADVVTLHTLALWGKPGAVEPRLDLARTALVLPLSKERELYLRFGAAAAHLQGGDAAEADRQVTRCIELARRLRHSGADVPIAWWRFYRSIDADDAASGRQLFAAAMERHRLSSVVAVSDMEPMAMLRLGEIGASVPDAYVSLGRGHANPAYRAFIGHALAESGRPQEGADLLGRPVPDGAWDYASMYGDCLRVDVLAAAERTEPLRDALARIRPWGHEFAIYGSTDCIGSIDYFVARGLERLGEVDAARAAYTRAAQANRTTGIVPWQRRAELRLGRLADLPDNRTPTDLVGEPPR